MIWDTNKDIVNKFVYLEMYQCCVFQSLINTKMKDQFFYYTRSILSMHADRDVKSRGDMAAMACRVHSNTFAIIVKGSFVIIGFWVMLNDPSGDENDTSGTNDIQ